MPYGGAMTPTPQPALAMLSIRWKTLSIAMSILTLAALSTTVIVASVRDVDVLSVVALALAVVAFVVQILVYIVQTASTENQTQHWSSLYTQMTSALATIEEKSERTRDAVDRLDPARIQQALAKAASEAGVSSETPPTGASPESVEEQVRRLSERAAELLRAHEAPPRSKPRAQSLGSFLDTAMSSGAMNKALEVVKTLKGIELTALRRLGNDQRRQEASGVEQVGLSTLNSPKSLHQRGLVARRTTPWSPTPVYQLTDLGMDVARILLAPPEEAQVRPEYQAMLRQQKSWDDGLEELRKGMRAENDAVPLSE